MARRGIKPSINALSTLMLLTVAVLLLVINKRTAKGDELIP
jgi:spermidine/putrescine transport system permease protein